ncbi:MAG: CPBP family intramembrane glutamate endopeptidase, partial [Intestinibacter sp.]
MKKAKIGIRDKEFLLDCFLILVVLQIGRIIIKNILLSVLNFTSINVNIANIVSIMIVGISVFLFLRGSNLFNPAGYRLTELSNKYDNKKIRIILFAITLLSLIVTVIFKSDRVFYGLLLICLSAIVVPFYEEMLFR